MPAYLITGEHGHKVRQGQHQVVTYPPAVCTPCICRQQRRQKISKCPRPCLFIGDAKLVQGLHQGCHDLCPYSIAFIAQQVQKRPAIGTLFCRMPMHCDVLQHAKQACIWLVHTMHADKEEQTVQLK